MTLQLRRYLRAKAILLGLVLDADRARPDGFSLIVARVDLENAIAEQAAD